MRSFAVLFLVSTCLSATGCVFRGIPQHGGGKRAYFEQQALAESARSALDGVDWQALAGRTVVVNLYGVDDLGGGEGGGGGMFLFGGAGFGWADAQPKKGTSESASIALAGSVARDYSAYAFSNKGDYEYLKGLIISKVLMAGGRIAAAKSGDADSELLVLVSNYGTNRYTDSYVVMWTEYLKARTTIEAFLRPYGASGGAQRLTPKPTSARFAYSESYILGFKASDPRVVDDSQASE